MLFDCALHTQALHKVLKSGKIYNLSLCVDGLEYASTWKQFMPTGQTTVHSCGKCFISVDCCLCQYLPQLEDEALKHIGAHCPELVTLNLQTCSVSTVDISGRQGCTMYCFSIHITMCQHEDLHCHALSSKTNEEHVMNHIHVFGHWKTLLMYRDPEIRKKSSGAKWIHRWTLN